MHATRYAVARLLRAVLVPFATALPPLLWVSDATRRASLTPLGRDQGIFQYVAWAVGQGQVDYRDVRDVNGPLAHLVHLAFLAFGGADEHRFRVLDLIVSGVVFAIVGACLPGLRARRTAGVERVVWASAAWVVMSGQYLLYKYWDLAQRESFFDWFLLASAALQLVAQAPPPASSPGRRTPLLALAGTLSVVPWFGKPTYALFTGAQLIALLADDALDTFSLRSAPAKSSLRGRWRALAVFCAGGALGAISQLASLLLYGDASAFARIQWVDVSAMYRFIWPRAAMDIFSNPWCATQAIFALAGAVVILALVMLGEMPRRIVGIALLPVCGLGSVVAQAKGFPYHFHPVTAGVHLQWLVFLAWLAERARVARRDRALVRLLPLAAAVTVALRVATSMEDSPHVRAAWLLWGARTPEERTTSEYYSHFQEVDYYPYELHQTAQYLRAHTQPGDRVQIYGMDPYVLFLAQRLGATPYIYAYDLNADAALAGGTGGHPDEGQTARIRSVRDAHEADLLRRISAQPPAAFVFFDGAPLLSRADAWDDFEEHCRGAAAWVRARYRETARFGHDRVWLRRDLATSAALREEETQAPDEAPSREAP
jgi:hypothetical protein